MFIILGIAGTLTFQSNQPQWNFLTSKTGWEIKNGHIVET